MKSFAPKINVKTDGGVVEVTPEGWMWVLGFALAGVPWAIEKALSPEFEMDKKLRGYELRRQLYRSKENLEALEVRVKRCRAEVEEIARNLHMLEE